jgi:uncharacterized protein YbaA (DUF1428 family)
LNRAGEARWEGRTGEGRLYCSPHALEPLASEGGAMAKYVDGFVIPISTDKIGDYKKIAKKACKVWMDHGALEYFECVGDDMEPKGMPVTATFAKIAKARAGETVIFAWILYRSRAHRDAVNKKVMADKRMAAAPKEMPFDMKRMSYAGFSAIVESK